MLSGSWDLDFYLGPNFGYKIAYVSIKAVYCIFHNQVLYKIGIL